MADNPVEHSRIKHIAIRYHFLRDHQQKGDIEIAYINTKEQLADIFTGKNEFLHKRVPTTACRKTPMSRLGSGFFQIGRASCRERVSSPV